MDRIPSDKPAQDPPHGSEPYDLGGENDIGALSVKQQQKLNVLKVQTRIDDSRYLRAHPELGCLLDAFIRECIKQRPENIKEFASEFFTSPDLPKYVERMLMERLEKKKLSKYMMKL